MVKKNRRRVSSDRRFSYNKTPSDFGTKERWEKGDLEVGASNFGKKVMRIKIPTPMDLYFNKGWISECEKAAADLLEKDFRRSGVYQQTTGVYGAPLFVSGGGIKQRSDKEEEAYVDWMTAVSGVPIKDRDVVISVVCYGYATHSVYSLKRGLSSLAKHYYGVI